MKLEITEKGVFNAEGKEIEVGTVLKIDADEIPASYLHKARVVDGKKTAVTNPKEGALPAKTAEELLEMAKDDSVHHSTLKAEAAKLLGGDTPSKKDEIIAKLEELATKPE